MNLKLFFHGQINQISRAIIIIIVMLETKSHNQIYRKTIMYNLNHNYIRLIKISKVHHLLASNRLFKQTKIKYKETLDYPIKFHLLQLDNKDLKNLVVSFIYKERQLIYNHKMEENKKKHNDIITTKDNFRIQ